MKGQQFLLTIVVITTILETMAGRLQSQIKRRKPLPLLEAAAFVNLQRTADFLMRGLVELLKPAGLSRAQYNVLRILRGAGRDGLACRAVGDRMITKDPDMTRLLDRLEARKLVARSREQQDRRVITARITGEGLRLLKELDRPVAELHERQLGHVPGPRLRALIELLETARERAT